jgi:uncharacterized membrane protein YdjX (TVP38/TMEM64 family)
MHLRFFGAWSIPRFMIELFPHAFSMLALLTHLLPLPFILALNTIHVPPIFVFVYGIKKTKKTTKK